MTTPATADVVDGDPVLVRAAQLIGATPIALLITVLVAMWVLGKHRGAEGPRWSRS